MSHRDYDLGTLEFPHTGFWVLHAIGIAGALYLGYKLGQEDECE